MTLNQALKKYKGKTVKIGLGSGFVYCGVVDDFCKEYLVKASKREYKNLQRRIRMEEKNIAFFNKTNNITMLEECIEYLKKLQDRMGRWTSFLNREVLEEYESVLNPDVTIILAQGEEGGKFWLTSECNEYLERDPKLSEPDDVPKVDIEKAIIANIFRGYI